MLIRLVYSLLLALVAPFFLYGLYRPKENKPSFGKRWKEHFGAIEPLANKDKPIWIHAVSVGESIAATPLIKELKKQNPQQSILVTTTTSTGAEQIAKLGELVEHRYMPIDFTFAVKRFVNIIRPEKLLIIETELWPNTLYTVHKAGIPITVVNARLSEKSRRNYAKVQPLFNLLHPCLTKVLCQTESDAKRFEQLGVEKAKLIITGSIKYDIQVSDQDKQQAKALKQQLGDHRPIWVAASTHKGEDEQVLAAHQQVLNTHPDALLILVPRHPERFNDVYELCEQLGFQTKRRTESTSAPCSDVQVYLGDTMGEMLVMMGAADVCFMGGSLLGDKVGGHNVLEPAALGLPVITGPSYYNFQDIVEELKAFNIVSVINHNSDLSHSIIKTLNRERLDIKKELKSNAIYNSINNI
ncbi:MULTISPECIES: lipid IV(A) 3-deoxy-D-manno-octulosonic acid transferase [unclassified Vibrio]|uniref:3-deoxy-D-manno-octulosonic acid transferase n=1 Tax=Vibrio sp. HB236076 TaxID=3232307 RepID=A0AB39HEY2_9VIBR|nr:lipid IV(A) 3-deoxy-D-manno-octulosonic acid transferase [Vibrio sp. HB161653]MDP5255396.1 lipid IV(A) 3-deoxy-D-manno-octulosonic acid transferase [Vibrio sp. HB161653]